MDETPDQPDGTEGADNLVEVEFEGKLLKVEPTIKDALMRQAVYTRKTQALAEQRKMFEGVDPERALQSVQFIDALECDPDFALQVYNELNGVLSQAGLLQAMEAAGVTPPQTPSPREPWEADDGSDSPLAKEVEELRQWKDILERQMIEERLASHIERQAVAVRSAHPDWSDSEMDSVFELAFAHGGDVQAAAESYASMRDRMISAYLESKGSVPTDGYIVSSARGHAEVPHESYKNLDEATAAAEAYLRNALSG